MIEDLAVSNMMKNKHLSKIIASQKLFEPRSKSTSKCNQNNIELRVIDRFYPSSKTCVNCGGINEDLKLKDREYNCNYGLSINRDLNSIINFRNAKNIR